MSKPYKNDKSNRIAEQLDELVEKSAVQHDEMGFLQSAGAMCVVDLRHLKIDQENYQRELLRHHKKIAKEFDPRACPPLLIGRRPDKSLWVIDGQQRREALMRLGIMHWNAVVFNTDGPETEARIFAICGGAKGTTKPLTKGEIVRAMIASNEVLALEAKKAIDGSGFRWKFSSGRSEWPYITCHTTILSLVKQFGGHNLERALKLISRTWPKDTNSLKMEIIWSVATLTGLHPQISDDRFVKRLEGMPCLTIINAARADGRGWRPAKAYTMIVKEFNWKLTSSRLPEKVVGWDSELVRKERAYQEKIVVEPLVKTVEAALEKEETEGG